jgi:hypothetical protein
MTRQNPNDGGCSDTDRQWVNQLQPPPFFLGHSFSEQHDGRR